MSKASLLLGIFWFIKFREDGFELKGKSFQPLSKIKNGLQCP